MVRCWVCFGAAGGWGLHCTRSMRLGVSVCLGVGWGWVCVGGWFDDL